MINKGGVHQDMRRAVKREVDVLSKRGGVEVEVVKSGGGRREKWKMSKGGRREVEDV